MLISTCKGNWDPCFETNTSISSVFRKKLTPLFTLLVLISGLLFSQIGYSQAKCPGLNCTANDVQINSVFLGDADGNALTESCEPGTPQTAYLYIDFSTNAPRNGLYFSGTLNGESLSTCFSQLLTGSSTRVQYPTQIDYTCGETLTLTDIFIAYNPGQDNFCTENPTGNCDNIVTSKCSRLPSVVVRAPLVADFTPLGSCPTTGQQAFQTYTFSTNITGGTANYSYNISFGDGTQANGISTDGTETITHTYTSGGSKIVTLTVVDAADRTDSHSETITVEACCQIAVTCPTPDESYNTDPNECNATLSFTATVPQNCSGATIAYSIGNTPITFPYDFPIGSTIVTVTATDADDNTATCNFTVVVEDSQNPGITCPTPNASYNTDANDCNATLSFTATATDNCSQAPTVSYEVGGQTITFPYDFPVGSTTVTAIATDGAGNTASCTFEVVVADGVDPEITCPTPDASYNTDANDCNATLSFTATATDNCSQAPTVSYEVGGQTITFPYDFPVGSTTVTAIATDGAGNTASCTFEVVVADGVDPGITCPTPAASYNTDANECNATLTLTATATDNCSAEPTITYEVGGETITFPYDFPLGSTTVTATATDGAGNTASCTYTVVVVDSQAPGITCPTPAASYNTDANECNATLTFTATATDNCSTPTVTYKIGQQTITFPYDFPVGSTTVTATAKDAANNTASCTFTVVVVDRQRPVITCPPARTVNCASNIPAVATTRTALVNQGGNATDNCAVQSINHVSDVITTCTVNSYVITRTYTATDVNGNVSLPCTQLITVNTTVSTPCFNYNLLSRTVNSTSTTFRFQVCAKQNCAALSYIAFVIPKTVRVISPVNGSTYQGLRNSYRVSVPVNKTQHGVKYEVIGEGIKNGTCDVFTFTLAGNQSNLNIEVIAKAGNKTYPATVNSSCISCQSTSNLISSRSVVDPATALSAGDLTVTASPNPFKDRVRFVVESSVAGPGSLEVFNTLGQKITTVYKGYMPAGKQVFEYVTPGALRMNVIYVLTVGNKRVTGKLINMR